MPPESEVEEILLLKVVKSAAERYPLIEREAWAMEKTPVDELYARGAVAESEVLEILLLKTDQSLVESAPLEVAEAVGRLKVMVFPVPVTVKSVPEVEVAKSAVPAVV